MPHDRDRQPPKAGRLWERPKSEPVPSKIDGDITSRIDLTDDEKEEARFRRKMLNGQRAISLKVAAGNRVWRDELRGSRLERERRRAAEDKLAERRHRIVQRIVGALTSGKFWTAIGAAIAGILTALKATGNL